MVPAATFGFAMAIWISLLSAALFDLKLSRLSLVFPSPGSLLEVSVMGVAPFAAVPLVPGVPRHGVWADGP